MTKTSSVNKKKINEIVLAITQLKAAGLSAPTADDIAKRVELNKAEKTNAKKNTAKKVAKDIQALKEASKYKAVKFKDNTEIVTETEESIKNKGLEEYVKNIIARLGGLAPGKVSIINRWYIGKDLSEAAEDRLRAKVMAQVKLSSSWATYAQQFYKTLPFIQELTKLIETAKTENFHLLWNHIIEAAKTKNCQKFIYWLEIAIANKMTAQDLGRAIANNADNKVKGQTRKETYIAAVKDNVQTRTNLVNKLNSVMNEKEDIEVKDMEIGDFVTKLYSIVDTGFFNIRMNR